MTDYSKFLQEVESMNEKYASIYMNCELEPLTMPFWSWQEIQHGLSLRQEWEVDASLIPFYGDWHDLYCLNEGTGEIVALNDDREVLCKWASIKEFESCLSDREINFDDELQAGVSLSHDVIENTNQSKKKH